MEMTKKEKKAITKWSPLLLLLLAIAAISIYYIFKPVEIHTTYKDMETISSYPAYSFQGALLLSETWKKYPDYIIGLGITGGLAFAGSVYVAYRMCKEVKT